MKTEIHLHRHKGFTFKDKCNFCKTVVGRLHHDIGAKLHESFNYYHYYNYEYCFLLGGQCLWWDEGAVSFLKTILFLNRIFVSILRMPSVAENLY